MSKVVYSEQQNRILWLDTCRGLAIILLILVHYVGALESRNIISNDVLVLIKSILRVATPFFILMFGFTFTIAYERKLRTRQDVKKLYFKLLPRLGLVLLGREVIVIASALRYPEMQDYLLSTLFYQGFSKSGEILTFYFFAIACAPFVLYSIKDKSKLSVFGAVLLLYSITYYVGSNYYAQFPTMWFRLFFYDVYAFFPFFSLVILGMLLAKLYKQTTTNFYRAMVFGSISVFCIAVGSVILNLVTSMPLLALANATLKAPPHIAYMLIYIGGAVCISSIVALLVTKKWTPQAIYSFLDIIGRNSLLAYVLHYFLFISTPISQLIFTRKSTMIELVTFVVVLLTMYGLIYYRDYQKISANTKIMEPK